MYGFSPKVTSDAVQVLRAVQFIRLQELAYIVVIDLEGCDLHGVDINGFHRYHQDLVFRQDHPLSGKTHLRLLAREEYRLLELFLKTRPLGISQPRLQCKGDLSDKASLGIHLKHIVLYPHGIPALVQGDQAAHRLVRLEVVRK